MYPYYTVRFIGGLLYLVGMFLMAYNVYKTISGAKSAATVAQTA
jgi:cytochrome c oxidase cbb3-type subunit 1